MANAKRVAFFPVKDWHPGMRAFKEQTIEFEWCSGMSWQQRQKSSLSMLHVLEDLGYVPAEISRRSVDLDFGVQLSAFNLKLNAVSVENIFQAYKLFNDGGPYLDLLHVDPKRARNDCRIQTHESKKPCLTHDIEYKNKQFFDDESICVYCQNRLNRHLIGFTSGKVSWETEPKSMFYDAVYIAALLQNPSQSNRLIEYNAFTDIEFNQKIEYSKEKGPFNCQARSCAIFTTLKNADYTDEQIADMVHSPEQMKRLYGHFAESTEQPSFF